LLVISKIAWKCVC